MTAFKDALALRSNSSIWWLEIAGVPYAFGTRAKTSSWFSGRASDRLKFEGIKPWLGVDDKGIFDPQLSPQAIDYFEGRVNIATARVVLVDVDDTLASYFGVWRTDARSRVTSDVSPTPSSIPIDTPLSPGPNVAHIGLEAVKYSSISGAPALTVASGGRGWYRSPAQAHVGKATDGYGTIATNYIRALESRRVWLYYGLDAESSEDAVCVFSGIIRATGWQNGARELVLQLDDSQGGATKQVFADISTAFEWPQGISADSFLCVRPRTDSDEVAFYYIQKGTKYAGADGSVIYLLDGDNVVKLVRSEVDDPTTGTLAGYLAFQYADFIFASTSFKPHDDGILDSITLVVPIVEEIFTAGIGPIDVALQILMSTGTNGANGDYDTLPAAWGCGLTEDDIDLATFEAAKDHLDAFKITMPVLAPESAREFIIRECLRPFGLYLQPTFDGRIALGSLTEVVPSTIAGLPAITDDDLAIDEKGALVQLDGPVAMVDEVVKGITWTDCAALVNAKIEFPPPITVVVAEDVTRLDEVGNAKLIEIKSAGLGGRGFGRTGEYSGFAPPGGSGMDALAALVPKFESRFQRPPSVITAAVKITRLLDDVGNGLNPGDLVKVSFADMPDIYRGQRGISGAVHEIRSRRWDIERSCVILELARSGLGAVEVRHLAPAAEVVSWNGTTKTVTVQQNAFSTNPRADNGAFIPGAAGTGDAVVVCSSDLGTRSDPVTLLSCPTATTMVLSAVPTRTPTAGDIIEVADFGDALDRMKGEYAYCADDEETLLGAAPDVHS
jgi:hypothetical protein